MTNRVPCPNNGRCGHQTHFEGSESLSRCLATAKRSTNDRKHTVVLNPSFPLDKADLALQHKREQANITFQDFEECEEVVGCLTISPSVALSPFGMEAVARYQVEDDIGSTEVETKEIKAGEDFFVIARSDGYDFSDQDLGRRLWEEWQGQR